MTEENKGKKTSKITVIILIVVILIAIITGIVLIMSVNGIFNSKEEVKILTSSTLMEVVDIAELSTSQFTFNGIATVYNEKKTEKIDCQIRYDAVVNAKIDMKKVQFEIIENEKKVNVKLPEITLDATLITENKEDREAFSFIPEKADLELKKIIEVCEKDATEEAQNSKELLTVAEENLKDTITALLYPIVNEQGYQIIWNEDIEKNDTNFLNEVEVVSNEIP